MFESFAGTEKRRRPLRPVIIGLAVSLLVHGALVYGLYHARITVKILSFGGDDLRNVMIVPPLNQAGPKIVGPAPGGAASPEPLRGGPPNLGSGAGREAAPPEPSPPPSQKTGETRSRQSAPAAEGSVVPALASQFQQSVASRFKSESETGLTIKLGPPGVSPPGPERKAASGGRGRPDFYQYIGGSGSGGGGRGAGPGGSRGGSGFGQRAAMTIPLKGYNLEPWARLVVDILQRNWDLPAVGKPGAEVRIRLFAVIKKDGRLDSMEILETTGLEILDQSALKALRTSFPLPELPADFPGDMLEVFFEFIYD